MQNNWETSSKDRDRSTAPNRILQYTYGGNSRSGIESYLLDAYQQLDKSKLQFDFLFRYASPIEELRTGLEELGSTVVALNVPESSNVVKRQAIELARLWRHLRATRPTAVEINMTSAFMNLQAALLARIAGARIVIQHAHDSAPGQGRLKRFMKAPAKAPLRWTSSALWACSEDAATFLYGKGVVHGGKWRLVRNSVQVSSFAFSASGRRRVRAELGASKDVALVGIVGRLNPQKNHARAIQVFREYLKRAPLARLVIVGDGPLREVIEADVSALRLRKDSVVFLGSRTDVADIYSGLDSLLAPSHHEGFPIVALEAQAAGLPVVASTAFPAESKLLDSMTRISLADSDQIWADALDTEHEDGAREEGAYAVFAAGYDRTQTAVQLERLYDELFDANDGSGGLGRNIRAWPRRTRLKRSRGER